MGQTEPVPLHARPERPIEIAADDLLQRDTFVTRLTTALIDTNTGKATGIVVGITGAWGSGKSSVLNLVSLEVQRTAPQAVVVRFDPWLVSGRNDLIGEFLLEVTKSIRVKKDASAKLKAIAGSVAVYAELLAPTLDFWLPGIVGRLVANASRRVGRWSEKKPSLNAQRDALRQQLADADAPIVVLIDEVDRIEDEEIRAVAQLVRSVADFPGISYVLAYDQKRVIQALGAGAGDNHVDERGRSYLEKVVQLQIPLPVTFAEELAALLNAELATLQVELHLPDNFKNIERYSSLVALLSTEVISTPRDISRLVGTFHVLGRMLRDEVDWIDLLGYCALVVKAPRTAEMIRERPDDFSDDMLSEASVIRRMSRGKKSEEQRLAELVRGSENSQGVRKLVTHLFPSLSKGGKQSRHEHPDAIYMRRPLLTTLRLGLLHGAYSRAAIEALVSKSPDCISTDLQAAWQADSLAVLIDRLDDLYRSLTEIDHVSFWTGVGKFLEKPNCEWIISYSPMHEVIGNCAEVLERAVIRDATFKPVAAKVFHELKSRGEGVLTAYWLRRHFFIYGLFGRPVQRSEGSAFLSRKEVEAAAIELSNDWRSMHKEGKLVPCRWDLQPVYSMIDIGLWDAECRAIVDSFLDHDDALDGLCLLLYGGDYTTDANTVNQICSREKLLERIAEREKSPQVHETVRVAMRKARGDGLP